MHAIRWNGRPITQPGIYSHIPLQAYHGQQVCDGPSVSSSDLKRVLEVNAGSAAHFWAGWSGNPNRSEPEVNNEAMAVGRAAHHLLLGEPNFREHFAIRPLQYDSWRSNAAKTWRDEMTQLGLVTLTPENMTTIAAMAQALERAVLCPSDDPAEDIKVSELLTGWIEHSFIWKDKPTGIWRKSRPDAIPSASGDFADLKTTNSLQFQNLSRTISNFAYHQAAANVAEGARALLDNFEFSSFALVFAEAKPPYCVRPIFLQQEDISRGDLQNRAALAMIDKCLRERKWPGPGGNRVIEHINLPDYYCKQVDREIAEITRLFESERRAAPQRKQA